MSTLLGAARPMPRASAGPLVPVPIFPAPGGSIEVLAPDQPVPYVPPLPGMQIRNWRLAEEALEIAPASEGPVVLGPSLVRLDYVYEGRPLHGAQKLLEIYRGALSRAGWKVEALPGARLLAGYRDWLIRRGIAPDRLTAQGYGETRPVAQNSTLEGRMRNRRVVLVKLP